MRHSVYKSIWEYFDRIVFENRCAHSLWVSANARFPGTDAQINAAHQLIKFTENRYHGVHSGHPQLCGNASGSLTCPDNYVCQQDSRIENPNYGLTSFDTIFVSFLTVFRLAGRDYWEEVLRNLIATAGPWHIISFIFVIVYCSFELVALIWGQIAVSYKYLDDERWENDLLSDLHEV